MGVQRPGRPRRPDPAHTLTVGISATTQTPLFGTPFTIDLSALQPCAYVVRLTITDRAIVNSVTTGHQATIDRGVCLE